MEWILAVFTILGGLAALWFFKDRVLSPSYRWLHRVWIRFHQRRNLITVTIRKGDIVRVKILDYKYPRDLGPVGRSWQDPHVRLLEWYNGKEFVPISIGFKAVLAESKSSVSRYLGDRSGEGMLIPSCDDLPEQCWDTPFIKNSLAWGVLKKLIVFETFVAYYRKTLLEAKVFSGESDGFLHLTNEDYDKILEQEYRVCIPLMNLFQNKGHEWVDRIQNMPVSQILGWVRQNFNELRGWIRGAGIEIDENSVTDERLRTVLVSLMPPHILRELYKV